MSSTWEQDWNRDSPQITYGVKEGGLGTAVLKNFIQTGVQGSDLALCWLQQTVIHQSATPHFAYPIAGVLPTPLSSAYVVLSARNSRYSTRGSIFGTFFVSLPFCSVRALVWDE